MDSTTTSNTEKHTYFSRYPTGFISAISSVLVLQMVIGLACNLTVLSVFHLSRRGHPGSNAASTSTSHTSSISTALITNLNIIDIIVSITGMPLTLTYVLTGPQHSLIFCLCHEAAVSFVTCASALNLLIISLDRHYNILKPFSSHLFKKSNFKWILFILWSLSVLGLCGPFLILIGKNVAASSDTHMQCQEWAQRFGRRVFFEIYYILVYIIANIVMIVCYVRIFRLAKNQLYSRAAAAMPAVTVVGSKKQSPALNTIQKHNERTVTKMTLMVVLTFMICWAPQATQNAITLWSNASQHLEMVQITCVTLAYTASVLHPLLYAFIRKDFRDNFRTAIRKRTLQVFPAGIQSPRHERVPQMNSMTQPIFQLQHASHQMAAHVQSQMTSPSALMTSTRHQHSAASLSDPPAEITPTMQSSAASDVCCSITTENCCGSLIEITRTGSNTNSTEHHKFNEPDGSLA